MKVTRNLLIDLEKYDVQLGTGYLEIKEVATWKVAGSWRNPSERYLKISLEVGCNYRIRYYNERLCPVFSVYLTVEPGKNEWK